MQSHGSQARDRTILASSSLSIQLTGDLGHSSIGTGDSNEDTQAGLEDLAGGMDNLRFGAEEGYRPPKRITDINSDRLEPDMGGDLADEPQQIEPGSQRAESQQLSSKTKLEEVVTEHIAGPVGALLSLLSSRRRRSDRDLQRAKEDASRKRDHAACKPDLYLTVR